MQDHHQLSSEEASLAMRDAATPKQIGNCLWHCPGDLAGLAEAASIRGLTDPVHPTFHRDRSAGFRVRTGGASAAGVAPRLRPLTVRRLVP